MNFSNTPPSPRTALVLYGSETGNAHDLAEELGSLTERLHFTTQVSELNAVNAECLVTYTVTIIVISTTGQGELPMNARSLWRTLLLKRLPSTYLHGVNFVLFGLGDSSYPKFNWASRKLYKRLLQLGANELYPRGEADQRHPEGLEATFLPWSVDLRKHLLDRYPLPLGQVPLPDHVQLPPKWVLEDQSDLGNAVEAPRPGISQMRHVTTGFPDHDIRPIPDTMIATLTENKRITPENHWQDVRHISMTVPELISYAPGDMIAITPKNSPEDAEHLLQLLGWTARADKLTHLAPMPSLLPRRELPPPPMPSCTRLTLRILLTEYLDIRAIPRRSFFLNLSHYTDDTMHKERLLEFTNPENVDDLWDYTTRPRRSIIEVLEEFDTVKIPWQHALSVFPVLRSRQFSIASGGELKQTFDGKTRFELLVAVVKYRTIIKKTREGVCTRYLAQLRPGSTLKVQLQRGGLNPTLRQIVGPTVLIGPGTGLAPLRAMIWEKVALVKTYREKHPGTTPPIKPTILLFGCRNQASDYFFEDEWRHITELIDLRVITAFSRDQSQKIYVQDKIRENYPLFFQLLYNQLGSVFICGSSGLMPHAVREALVECFQCLSNDGNRAYSRGEAEQYLIGMEKTGRYKQETW